MHSTKPPHALRIARRSAPHINLAAIFLCALFLLCQTPLVFSQNAAPNSSDNNAEEVITERQKIFIAFFVTDRSGRRVAGLTDKDFLLHDDGAPSGVVYFVAGATKVSFVFALDASTSVREQIMSQREAANTLLSKFGANARVAVIHFDEKPSVALPFSNDARALRSAFRIASERNRRTALFDAALAAVQLFDANQSANAPERRIVILISDGLDNASAIDYRNIISEANRRQVSFYVIHFPFYVPRDNRLQPRAPSKGFRELATATGGAYFRIGDAETALNPRAEFDLTPALNAIAEDLQGQYVLGFRPSATKIKSSTHRVEVTLRPELARKYRVRLLRDSYEITH